MKNILYSHDINSSEVIRLVVAIKKPPKQNTVIVAELYTNW